MDDAREEFQEDRSQLDERRKTWESIPEADRQRFVNELAKLMVRMVDEGHFEDQSPSS